jgi:hypothetical protein
MVLWVNLHGGFLVGLGAVGLALLLRIVQGLYRDGCRVKTLVGAWPLAVTLAACAAATLINPLGWRLWPYLATELSFQANRVYIKEWQPIWHVWDLWPALVPFFALLGVTIVVGLRRQRVAGLPAWVWLLSCLPQTLMAFQSNRHIPVQVIWVAPVAGLLAASAVRESASRLWLGVTGSAAVVAVLAAVPVLLDPRPHIGLGPSAFGATRPDRAVAFMKVNYLRGHVYTPLWWGSYVTWELHPDVDVSMDGRNVTLFAPETVAANFRFYTEDRPDLDWLYTAGGPRTPGKEGIYVLAPRDMPGLEALRADRRWVMIYEDEGAVLFVRHTCSLDLGQHERGALRPPPTQVGEFFP